MYSRAQYEAEVEALERASSLIAAAVEKGSDYSGRLSKYTEALRSIADYFQGREAEMVADRFMNLIDGVHINGVESLKYTAMFERIRLKLKGKLLVARLQVEEGKIKKMCADPKKHGKGCSCKALKKLKLADMEEYGQ